jgi:hypothetical protein
VLFYNPAAARRVKGTGITASASFMYMQWLRVKDLNGLGLDARESASNNAPKLLVGSFDPKGSARLRISFGFVNNLYGRFEVKQSAAVRVEGDPDQPGTDRRRCQLCVGRAWLHRPQPFRQPLQPGLPEHP